MTRIKKSSKYDNIAAFFMENPDPEAEGMGLGLSMVVVLLKNINITHKNFAVTTNGIDKTYAKVLNHSAAMLRLHSCNSYSGSSFHQWIYSCLLNLSLLKFRACQVQRKI